MLSNKKDKLSPAEQDDDSGNVLEHKIINFEEEQDEREDNQDDFENVLQAEDVSAEGDKHLEEFPGRDEAEEHNGDRGEDKIISLILWWRV